jgi:hypothetical protein
MTTTLPPDPDRYRRLRELVDWAADQPAAEWATFLERQCPADSVLQSEALRLLKHAQAASSEGFMEPASWTTEHSSPTPGGPISGAAQPVNVGKFLIVRGFSEIGGQGTAYLAFDPDLERHVVLKRYHGGPHGPSGEAEEGRALAKIDSPYVAGCLGIERIDGEAYLVVEYVPGRNLAEVRRDGPMDLARVVGIVSRLAEGVAAVHARGLVHRDIKPANVILHDDGMPRLVDFGLAVHLGGSRLRGRSGSPPFMAPEQARGESDRIDFRTDVFGLGGVLYKLLTDHEPHAGSTVREILENATKADITPPRQLDPTIPAPVEAVCLKALAAAPENRYTTPLEFAAALRQAIEPAPVAPPALVGISGRFRRPVMAAVGACAIMALAVGTWLGWPRSTPSIIAAPAPASAPAAGPLEAEIEVTHFKDKGAGQPPLRIGTVSETSLAHNPPRLKDMVRARVTLSRPADCFLIALNPDGKAQLCLAAGGVAPGAASRDLDFPEYPGDFFGMTDGVGLQAFVVVAFDGPLPAYEAWKAQVPGGLAWSPTDRGGYGTYNSSARSGTTRFPGTLRGDILRRDSAPEPLVSVCERIRRSPGVTSVHAVAFPVKPDQEIIK